MDLINSFKKYLGVQTRRKEAVNFTSLLNTLKITLLSFIGIICLNNAAFAIDWKEVKVKPNVIVSETYNDNISLVKDQTKSDFITKIGTGVTAEYNDDFKALYLNLEIYREIFAKNNHFDNTSEELNFNYEEELNKFEKINFRNYFLHSYEASTFEDAFVRTLGRYSHYSNHFDVEYTNELDKQNLLHLLYINEIDIFSRRGAQDSYLNKFKVQKDYISSSSTTYKYYYQFANRTFSPGHSSQENNFSAGLKQSITKQLYFEGFTGVDLIHACNEKLYIKPRLVLSLIDDLSENSNLDLTFTKEHRTTAYTEDLFDNWNVSLTFKKQPFKKLSYTFSTFYGEGKYVSLGYKDKFAGAEIGLYYHVSPNSKVGIIYSFTNSDSSERTREYSNNIITTKWDTEF